MQRINNFKDLVGVLFGYLQSIVPLLLGVAVVGFLYGVVKYVYSGGDEEKRKEGIKFITYGIVGIAVIVGMWGLVQIITNSFGLPFGTPSISPGSLRR